MPYHILKTRGPKPYKIIETSTGKTVGSSKTMKDAQGSIAHRMDAEGKKGRK